MSTAGYFIIQYKILIKIFYIVDFLTLRLVKFDNRLITPVDIDKILNTIENAYNEAERVVKIIRFKRTPL